MKAFWTTVFGACCLALGACGQEYPIPPPLLPPPPEPNYAKIFEEAQKIILIDTTEPIPKNHRQVAATIYRAMLKDPYSVRDAEISKPLNRSLKGFPGWTVCIRSNSKNGFGAYSGVTTVGLIISENRYRQLLDGGTEREMCGGLKYEPFPELRARES
jgi:hypothetical protein